jgi:hypothetical protein
MIDPYLLAHRAVIACVGGGDAPDGDSRERERKQKFFHGFFLVGPTLVVDGRAILTPVK